MRVQAKICCISTPSQAALAIRSGADALGLVSAMPSGPGVIPEATIRHIVDSVAFEVDTFLLTSLTAVDEIRAQHRRCGTKTIQLTDRLRVGSYAGLRADLDAVRLVHVVHVGEGSEVAEAVDIAPHVDALLLDSGRPGSTVKELGGTGRTHDWSTSRAVVEAVNCPVYLAGGLRPDNVAEAIREVRPFGVDVCTGVRTDGRLDAAKLKSFIDAVRSTSN